MYTVLVQVRKEKKGGGEGLGAETMLHEVALGLPLVRTPLLPERVMFAAHLTRRVADIKWQQKRGEREQQDTGMKRRK